MKNFYFLTALSFLLLIKSLIVAGQDTISYINGGCINHELKMAGEDTCPRGIFFSYQNDSLIIYGRIGANCCGTHMAIISTINDTIFINTADSGLLCTCSCEFCFSMKIPASVKDTLLSLNGTLFNTQNNVSSALSENIENSIRLVPNPTQDKLYIFTGDLTNKLSLLELINGQGILIKTVNISGSDTLYLDMSDRQNGLYFIRFKMKNNNSFTRKIVKK